MAEFEQYGPREMPDQSTPPAWPPKKPKGRPTKLTNKIIQAFKEVLSDENMVLACTDKELFFMLNMRLEEDEQVSYRSFQRYKARAMSGGFDTDTEPIYKQLFRLFYEALIRQKTRLMELIARGDRYWQRFKWIMERKFKEWHAQFSMSDEAKEEEEPPPSLYLTLPYVPEKARNELKCLEDKPFVTWDEWYEKYSDEYYFPYLENIHFSQIGKIR